MSPIFGVKIYFPLSVNAKKIYVKLRKSDNFCKRNGPEFRPIKIGCRNIHGKHWNTTFTEHTGILFHSVKDIVNS